MNTRKMQTSVVVVDRLLADELEGLQVGTALDLGCGSGQNALELAAEGWLVLGVDWAEHAIDLARNATTERRLNAEFVVGDITSWKSPRQFDLVVSTYALPGGKASELALQTARSALAKSGTIIVAEWDRSMSEVWPFDADDLMTPEQIVALLPGLEIEKAEMRQIDDMFTNPDDPRRHGDSWANIAFVRARRP